MYAHEIIQSLALIEYYGTQLVNEKIFMPQGSKRVDVLRLVKLNRILITVNLISKEQFKKLEKLRKIRNKLAHRPNAYLDFSEKRLYKLSSEAHMLAIELRRLLNNI